ncbi:MAG: leucyl/phenylalanyl-tRNA--protein transferase [Polyangiaceae bacterium]
MHRPSPPKLLHPGRREAFPDPRLADDEGLVAVGGDLSPWRLMAAYERGIFPWYNGGVPPLWWSPDPRTVLDPCDVHVSRSLRRVLRRGTFRVTSDRAFSEVIRACAEERSEGTWILPEMIEAYEELFEMGHAHSFEVWDAERLVGGLYGVAVGRAFAAESMFHRATDASKVGLVVSIAGLERIGLELFDVQFLTDHLASLGAKEIPRRRYLDRLKLAQAGPGLNWEQLRFAQMAEFPDQKA